MTSRWPKSNCMKLIIGNKNYSSWSMRPWLLLKHFNVPFEEVRIPLFIEGFEQQLAVYTDANKVPVLHDGDLEVWDSLAICEYISEQYLDNQGWPADSVARSLARSASAEMHSSFLNVREQMPMNCRSQKKIDFGPDVLGEIERIDRLWQSLKSRYQSDGPWLLGTFSIADCMYAPMASRFHSYLPTLSDISSNYVATVLKHPSVQQWFAEAEAETEVIQQSEVGTART